MKEIISSAAAIAGLLSFAYYANQPAEVRAKRSSIHLDEELKTDTPDGSIYESMVGDFNNLTSSQMEQIMADLTGDDVQAKQYVQSRMRNDERTTRQFHSQLNTAFERRWAKAAGQLNSVESREGNCNDPTFVKNSECSMEQCTQDPVGCFNYAQNRRADEYLESHGYSEQTTGGEVFNNNDGLGGANAFYYVVPRAIPLNSVNPDDHISDYQNYLQGFYNMKANGHFPNNLYLSYVIWQNGAAAAPKNLKYRGSIPTSRMNRFWSKPGAITNQPFMVKSVQIFANTVLGRLMHNSPDNTVSGSRNCFVLWFHQDMPADLHKFTNGGAGDRGMGGSEAIHTILSRCTVAHAWVVPDFQDWNGIDTKSSYIKRATAALMGDDKVAVSDDFSGRFILNSYEEIGSNSFHTKVMRFFAAAKRRRLCQLAGPAWQPSEETLFESEDDFGNYAENYESELYEATAAPGGYENNEPFPTDYSPIESDEPLNPDSETYDYDASFFGNLGEEVVAAPVVDRCCGHGFAAKAFASSGEKSCCTDDAADPLGLSPYLTTGGCSE